MPLRLDPYPVPRLLVSSGPGHPRLATVPTPGAVADALAAGDLGPALYAGREWNRDPRWTRGEKHAASDRRPGRKNWVVDFHLLCAYVYPPPLLAPYWAPGGNGSSSVIDYKLL